MKKESQYLLSTALNFFIKVQEKCTQKILAIEINEDQSQLSKLQNGNRPGTLDTWLKIAEYFDTTIEEMIEIGRKITEHGPEAVSALVSKNEKPIINLKDRKQHSEIIKEFKDVKRACELSKALATLETMAPDKYDRLFFLAKGYLEQVKIKKEEGAPPGKNKVQKQSA